MGYAYSEAREEDAYDPVLKDSRVNSDPVEVAMVEVVSAATGVTIDCWKREKREVPVVFEASEGGGAWKPVAADC